MNTFFRVVASIAIALILLLSGVMGGLLLARQMEKSGALPQPTIMGSSSQDPLVDKIERVQEYLDREALKPPSDASATAGAINGLLESSGDKYAQYFDAKHFKFFNEQTMGAFGGIGVSLGEGKDGRAYIIEVYPDTPAERAGIKAGDVFVSIEGVTRDKWTSDEVVKRVRGDEGTKVTVVMKRKGAKKPLTFKMTRATIEYPNTKAKLYGNVGYIRMGSFNAKSAEEITREMKALEKKGAKGFILDLRDNPGGLLTSAVDVSSLYVKSGVIVRVEERGKKPTEYRANGRSITELPLVVIVNENSASASEIAAGALQDYGRATLVGVQTFGKGSVQTVRELPDGGAIKFTTAHYLTPKGRAINGKGLKPDVVVKMKLEDQMDEKTDKQLAKALEVLRSKL
ncbi:MAG: S41 family peptidase [Coriobacteriales bacterium]|nr:S41 family peptidase [Coriobacteriales bacterium]